MRARVTSLPPAAFVINGIATMTASVIVEYTIDTRAFGVPATVASNLIDSLLSTNTLLLSTVLTELPAIAFTGPVAAGDASFLRCVVYTEAKTNVTIGSWPTVSDAPVVVERIIQNGGGYTLTQLVLVGALPFGGLLGVVTLMCVRLRQEKRPPSKAAAPPPHLKAVGCECGCHGDGGSVGSGYGGGLGTRWASGISVDDIGTDPCPMDVTVSAEQPSKGHDSVTVSEGPRHAGLVTPTAPALRTHDPLLARWFDLPQPPVAPVTPTLHVSAPATPTLHVPTPSEATPVPEAMIQVMRRGRRDRILVLPASL